MNCPQTNVWIEYLDKELDPIETKQLKEHLKSCSACRKTVNEFQILNETIDNAAFFLNEEEAKPQSQQKHFTISRRLYVGLQIAAGIALFLMGRFAFPLANTADQNQIAQLQQEVSQTKSLVMLSMLKQDSPGARIKAVNYTQGSMDLDSTAVDALFNTLNTDPNVNVRMSAAYGLGRHTHREDIRLRLVKSLSDEEDPMVQIALIDILVRAKEPSTVDQLFKILKDDNLNDAVKSKAEQGVGVLL